MKRKDRLKLYFSNDQPKHLGLLLAGGGVAFASGAFLIEASEPSMAALSFLLGALFLAGVIAYRAALPGDSQVDSWLEEDLADLIPRALDECNWDASDQIRGPVIIVGPTFPPPQGVELAFRKGADGQIRVSPLKASVFIFCEHQLGIYSCDLDFLEGRRLNEGAHVLAYRFVMGSSTSSTDLCFNLADVDKNLLKKYPEIEKSAVGGKIRFRGAQSFTLTTVAGKDLTLWVSGFIIANQRMENDALLRKGKEAVKAVQTRLKEVAGAEGRSLPASSCP